MEDRSLFRKKLLKASAIIISLFFLLAAFKPVSAVTPVEIYFSPDTATIPPDTSFSLMIDPKSQPIAFLQTTISFDPSKLQLASDVIANTTFLVTYLNPTAVTEANSSGTLELILYLRPGTPAPSSPFEIASVPFSYLDGATPATTDVTIVDEDTQIVDNSSPPNELPFSVRYASVTVGHAGAGGGAGFGAGFASAFAAMFKGGCPSDDYIDTAIGCIPVSDQNAMAQFFLSWGMGIAGGIAFILIVYAAYRIMTAAGDPKKLQAGKELLTAAISGLVLLVLSAFILRIIGLDILGIIGF